MSQQYRKVNYTGQNNNGNGSMDTTPWWIHQQFYEQDYIEDVMFINREVHHREQQEMNQRRREANLRDKETRLMGRLMGKFNSSHHIN